MTYPRICESAQDAMVFPSKEVAEDFGEDVYGSHHITFTVVAIHYYTYPVEKAGTTEYRVQLGNGGRWVASDAYCDTVQRKARIHLKVRDRLKSLFGECMVAVTDVEIVDEGAMVTASIFIDFSDLGDLG